MFGAVGLCLCFILFTSYIALWSVGGGGGGIAIHHVQVQSKES